MDTATFAAGCFWGVEETFRTTPGVLSTEVGYTGGHTEHPSYEDVCGDATGHAEAVRVTFDPLVISYDQLLDVFWNCHDPTQRNRQGPDTGSQYRSAIFVHSPGQRQAAEDAKAARGKRSPKIIATEIIDAGMFYPAEEYHQKYLMKRGMGSCHL